MSSQAQLPSTRLPAHLLSSPHGAIRVSDRQESQCRALAGDDESHRFPNWERRQSTDLDALRSNLRIEVFVY